MKKVVKESTTTITVAIPCIPSDLDNLLALLKLIARNSTRQPDEIIVSLSDCNDDETRKRAQEVSDCAKSLWPTLRFVLLEREESAMPGDNRNHAAQHATCDLVAFLDADDPIHERKLEIILQFFYRFPQAVLVSHLTQPFGYAWQNYESLEHIPFVDDTRFVHCMWGRFGGIARGSPSVRRKVLSNVVYDTNMQVGEDLQFLLDVKRHYGAHSLLLVQAYLNKYDYIATLPPKAFQLHSNWQKIKETRGLVGERQKPGWRELAEASTQKTIAAIGSKALVRRMVELPSNTRVYWINLDVSVERRQRMEARLREIGWLDNATRVSAIDAQHAAALVDTSVTSRTHALNTPEVACTLSHLKAMQMALEDVEHGKCKHALILEDDAFPNHPEAWKCTLRQLLSHAPSEYELLFLSWLCVASRTRAYLKGANMKRIFWTPHRRSIFGSFAYIVSHKGLRNTLQRRYNVREGTFNVFSGPPAMSQCSSDGMIATVGPALVSTIPLFAYDGRDSTIHRKHLQMQQRNLRYIKSLVKSKQLCWI